MLLSFSACESGPSTIPCPDFLPGCALGGGDMKNHPIWDLLSAFVSWIITISATGAILMCILAGILFAYSGANEEWRGRAAKMFFFAGLGLLVSIFAYFIVSLIDNFFNPLS